MACTDVQGKRVSRFTDIETRGFNDVLARIRELPGKPMRRVLRKGIRAQAAVVRKAAKRKTPRRTGALRNAIGTKVVTTKKKQVVGIVGARTGQRYIRTDDKGQKVNPVRYIHLVELGSRGKPGVGMLRNGANSTLGAQRAAFLNKAAPELDKQLRILRNKRSGSRR